MCLSDHRLNVAVNAQLTQAQTVSTQYVLTTGWEFKALL